MSVEQWRDVVGYEGQYKVSDHGNARSVDRTVRRLSRRGTYHNMNITGTALRPAPTCHGYLTVALTKPGVRQTRAIHRLVLEAFIGPCENGMDGCHNNGIKTDNRLENLRWDTRKNNHADKVTHGTQPMGSEVYCSVLNEWRVKIIKTILRDSGARYGAAKKIANSFGVSKWAIHDIKNGRNWKHVRIT